MSTDIEALYLLTQGRNAKTIDARDCARFHYLTAGRFDWRGRSAMMRSTTVAEMAMLLPQQAAAPSDLLLPSRSVAQLLGCSERKMRPSTRAWVQRHWTALLAHLVFWVSMAAIQDGRKDVVAADLAQVVQKEALVYAGYACAPQADAHASGAVPLAATLPSL